MTETEAMTQAAAAGPLHVDQDLVALLAGELAGGHLTRVEEHLIDCPRCREELEHTRRVLRAVRAVPAAAPSPDFEEKLRAKITHAVEVRRALVQRRRQALADRRAHPGARRAALRLMGRNWFSLSVSVAAGVAFMVISPHIIVFRGAPVALDITTPADHRADLRVERLLSMQKGRVRRVDFIDRSAQVAPLIPDGDVWMLSYRTDDPEERCVTVWTLLQRERFENKVEEEVRYVTNMGYKKKFAARWRRMYDRDFSTARVADGAARVPEDLTDRQFADTARVVLVSMRDRLEIWTPRNWAAYSAPVFDIQIERYVPAPDADE